MTQVNWICWCFRVFAVLSPIPLSLAETLVVPNIYEGASAIGPGAAPFNRTDFRLQQIYLSPQFASAAGDVLLIDEIRFRLDEQYAIGRAFSTVAEGLSIAMVNTTRNFDTAVPIYAQNYDGPLFQALPTSDLALSGQRSSSTSFDVVIPLPNAYRYDRQSGNLLVDIQIIGGANLPFLDQQIGVQDAAFTIAGAASSTVGTKSMQGLITQFRYSVVPEPTPLLLVSVGGLAIILILRGRRYT